MMSRVLLYITVMLFLLFGSVLSVTHVLSFQPQWNAVLFSFEWSVNMFDRDESQTWMIDVTTGLRRNLPFRYFDRATLEKAEDGNRVMLPVSGYNSEGEFEAGDMYIISRNTFEMPPFLTDHPGYDGEPDAVDDLRRIVFVSDRDTAGDLYILRLDLKDRPVSTQRVTFDELIERDPQWLTREQYHDYLNQFNQSKDTIILNPDEDNQFFDD
jgi:hypothetical protein